jgi:hypothetical protein
MTYTLSELPLLLGCTFAEARAWVRTLEIFESIERDFRGARLVSPDQLERIAAARVIASNRGISKVEAIKFVAHLDQALDTLQQLNVIRKALGVTALEARVTVLEKTLGKR